MAEEKRGIEETKDILDFVFSFVEITLCISFVDFFFCRKVSLGIPVP